MCGMFLLRYRGRTPWLAARTISAVHLPEFPGNVTQLMNVAIRRVPPARYLAYRRGEAAANNTAARSPNCFAFA